MHKLRDFKVWPTGLIQIWPEVLMVFMFASSIYYNIVSLPYQHLVHWHWYPSPMQKDLAEFKMKLLESCLDKVKCSHVTWLKCKLVMIQVERRSQVLRKVVLLYTWWQTPSISWALVVQPTSNLVSIYIHYNLGGGNYGIGLLMLFSIVICPKWEQKH